jgi:hypothetical protein
MRLIAEAFGTVSGILIVAALGIVTADAAYLGRTRNFVTLQLECEAAQAGHRALPSACSARQAALCG